MAGSKFLDHCGMYSNRLSLLDVEALKRMVAKGGGEHLLEGWRPFVSLVVVIVVVVVVAFLFPSWALRVDR